MSEHVFFEERGVKVTNARFIVNAQTYAMNGVTSVKSGVVLPSRGGPLAGLALGILIVAAADGGAKIIGVLIAAAAIWILSQQKASHTVFLSSASGEVQALTETDEGFIGRVIAALNDSLVHRG